MGYWDDKTPEQRAQWEAQEAKRRKDKGGHWYSSWDNLGKAVKGGAGDAWDFFNKGNEEKQLPYFEEDRNRLGGLLNGQSPFAGKEWGSLVGQLQDQAAGRGPSMAGNAYNKAQMDNRASLSSMARGSSSPAGARSAILQQGKIGQGMAQGYATAKTQEQMGAQSALAEALGKRDSINSGAYQNVLSQQLGLSSAQVNANLGKTEDEGAKNAQKASQIAAMIASIYSDEHLKTDLRYARQELDETMARLTPYVYTYIDEARHGYGERAGVMAQDLAATPLGAATVLDQPEGLAIDVAKGLSLCLAGMARLHERLDAIEKKGS